MIFEDDIKHEQLHVAEDQPSQEFQDGPSPFVVDSPSTTVSTVASYLVDPFLSCDHCELIRENNILRCEMSYWKTMHQKSIAREQVQVQVNEALQARVKQLEEMVFAQSSEKNTGKSSESTPNGKPRQKRGKPKGTPGHGRRRHDALPVFVEDYDLPEEEKCCPFCRLPFLPGFTMEESKVVEIEVKAHVRHIRRKQYKRGCSCENITPIITADGPAKLIARSVYGDSVWVEILVDKYFSFRPTHRLIQSLGLVDLGLAQGTITDGLKNRLPFLEPVYREIILHNQSASRWHADETRWMVFSQVEGKSGYRWYLWVFESDDSVVFILDQTRSSKVPKEHFKDATEGFLTVDRYKAYNVVAKDGRIILTYCWAHVRRDFIVVAKGYSKLEEWAMEWVRDIGDLYHLNGKRLELESDDPERIKAQINLENAIDNMAKKRDEQLRQNTLHPACEKVLQSLSNHWHGLIQFVKHPEVPMDNNSAERKLRGPVTGRKNFYGSGAQWSGTLAAVMFTIFQTLSRWDINPKTWLMHYFRACAENGSKVPDDLSAFLPWKMGEQRKQALQLPPSIHDTG